MDLEIADPARYQEIRVHWKNIWTLEGDEAFEQTWNREVSRARNNSLEISNELLEELKNRLAPFHYENHIIQQNVCRGEPLGYPFTNVVDILEYANDKPEKIIIPRYLTNQELQLIASSRAGALTQKFRDEITQKDLEEGACPLSVNDKDYVFSLEKDEKEIHLQGKMDVAMGRTREGYSEVDFIRYLPFKISMIELAKYYRADTFPNTEANLVVVIGDEVIDYCLYYCLSRMHEGIHWLPDNFLKSANNKIKANDNRTVAEKESFTETEEFASAMVYAYIRKVHYGQEQRRISIVSASLNDEQLQLRKTWMGNLYTLNVDELLASVEVMPLSRLSIHPINRAIELNNYANQQDMVFQNGKSVGRLNTPKPKNFSRVDPTKHRWITSIAIDEYRPPALPFLSKDIIGSLPMTYDTRIGVDGLAYHCPHIAQLGGDIDVSTIKPTLRLVDETEIFAKYFGHLGYEIELSDKGSYLKDTIECFGSLQATANFFRAKQNRDLFDQYLYTKDTANDDVAYHLDTEKRAYLSFTAFSRTLGDPDMAVALIDALTAKDILRRGFIFHCSRCRLVAWYGMGEVSREFTCKRCDLVQPLSQRSWKKTEEPRWYYRLVETVYLFYESHSYLTALTLGKLRQQSKEAFHYICESNLKNYPEQGEQQEIDILAISDGKLILGECKDCKPKTKDLSKYQWLQSKLRIKFDRFILATTEAAVSEAVSNKLANMRNANVLLRSDLLED